MQNSRNRGSNFVELNCNYDILLTCPSGGTGRRAGLKIRWPQGRDGSTPFSGTKLLFSLLPVLPIILKMRFFRALRCTALSPLNRTKPFKYAVFVVFAYLGEMCVSTEGVEPTRPCKQRILSPIFRPPLATSCKTMPCKSFLFKPVGLFRRA